MEYDLFSPTFKVDPYPTFARMRHDTPVYAHISPRGQTIWYITRYEDVITVLKDNERFIKDVRAIEPVAGDSTPTIHQAINQNMLFSDPPNHTRLRALVNQAFTPRRVAQMGSQIQAAAGALLDQIQQTGQADLISTFALPLPVIVIADMLGIPAKDRNDLFDGSTAIISPGRHHLSYRERRRKVRAFVDYLHDLFMQRRKHPGEDLITALVHAEESGDTLSEMELSSMVALLLVTGHETTVNLIGNGVLALLRNPDQLALLKNNPSIIDTAIEELLRFDGPVESSTTRWASVDLEFGGRQIKRGDIVRVVLSSANRDAAYFDHPDTLDLTRQDNRHLAFGHGIHYCLGAPLARLEGQIALTTLLKKMPNMRLNIEEARLRWHSGVLFRGLVELPVRWD